MAKRHAAVFFANPYVTLLVLTGGLCRSSLDQQNYKNSSRPLAVAYKTHQV
ncbi:hypothetical protein [Pseudobacteroides cellulosolvens]|uniref:hypothetical protein n=1 Tax=Pseudobacteroides cellulosolvens TaxID=35825 RepID=UPI0012B61BDF|nr:hypothetical protein [Pseudobacteroides cellulosolvens]